MGGERKTAFGALVERLFEMHEEAASLPDWAVVEEAAIEFGFEGAVYRLSLSEVDADAEVQP
jgi:hypothetical protein